MALSRRVLDDEPIIPNPSSKCSLDRVLEQEEEEEGRAFSPVALALSRRCMARWPYRDVYSAKNR